MASISTTSFPTSSLSWNQNGRSEQQVKPFATVDLHGLTREAAIREVTRFFDEKSRSKQSQKNPWVCVITGTGAHSGSLGGPILKQSVNKLLVKRNMEYCYCKKPRGCFKVNVHSGVVLKQNPTAQELQAAGGDRAHVIQETLWQDTKVKVMPREHIPGANATILPMNKKKAVGKKARKDMIGYATASGPQSVMLNSGAAPRPSELAAESKLLEQAKSISLKDTRKLQSLKDKEQHAVKQAMQKTQQEAAEEKREEEELARILALSQEEHSQHPVLEEEAELERILQLSLQESQTRRKDTFDEEEWQQILSQSQLESQPQPQLDEEAELERVLRLSMAESQTSPAPEMEDEEEEEALQKVLRLSMVEASVGIATIIGESVDDLGPSDLVDLTEENTLSDDIPPLLPGGGEVPGKTETLGKEIREQPLPENSSAPYVNNRNDAAEESSITPSLVPSSYPSSLSSGSNTTSVTSKDSLMEQKVNGKAQQSPMPNLLQALKLEETSNAQCFVQESSHDKSQTQPAPLHDEVFPASALQSKPILLEQPPAAAVEPMPRPPPAQMTPQQELSNGLQPTQAQKFTVCPTPIGANKSSVPSETQEPPATPQPTGQEDAPSTGISAEESLLQSILYKKPLPTSMQPSQDKKNEPETITSIHFNLDSPIKPTESQTTMLRPEATAPSQPVLPPAVLEHRLMEILQRPIVLPPASQPTNPPGTTTIETSNSLSPKAVPFKPPS